MSFNGSGTFLINTAGQPVVAGTVISSTAFNALTADLATGLSTVITKDGQTTVTANIPMSTYKFTGLGVGSAAGDSANLSQVQSTVTKLLTSVSGTDTITAVGAPVVAAYAAGQMFYFVATGDNTGAVTLNIDSLGAKAVTRDGSVALAAGDIKSGEVVVVVYDGTRFQVVSQLNSAGDARFANVSIASSLYVGGVSTFVGNAGFSANVSIASALSVGGVAAITGATTIGGNLTLNGGTANGVLYLNGSKVATSGSALVFNGSQLEINSLGDQLKLTRTTVGSGTLNIGGSGEMAYAAASHYWYNAAKSTEWMRLDSSGNLGIGTSSPDVKLRIDAASPTRGIIETVRGTGSTGSQIAFSQDAVADWAIGQPAGVNAFAFFSGRSPGADGTERARIDSNGRVVINGTTQLYSSTLTLYRAGNSYNLTSTVTGTGNEGHVVFENGNGAVGTIFTNGTATAYNTSSDYRLKNTIAPMTGALAKVALLKPCTYKWNADGSDGQGFIAHELAEVVPQCVTGEKDAVDAEGKPRYQGVDTSFLVATLTAAIQELTARVAQLETK